MSPSRCLAYGLLCLSVAPTVFAQTVRHVDDDATAPGNGSAATPFPDIAPAIAAAVSGDTILVADGFYAGFSFGGKDVEVRSANGKSNTHVVVAPLPSGNLIEIATGEGPGAILDGFTVQGGDFALWVSGASPTVRNCDFLGGGMNSRGVQILTPAAGPGVLFEDVTVAYFEFQQPYGADWTGLDVVGPGLFRRCEVAGNSSSFFPSPGPNVLGGVGAGLRAKPDGFGPGATPPVFEDCGIGGNSGGAAVGDPGGFGGVFGDAVFRRCRVVGNAGGYGVHLEDPPFCAPGVGGNAGMFGYRSATDCVVASNFGGAADDFAGEGGLLSGGPKQNCTVVENGSPAVLTGTWRNCIVRDNGPPGSSVFTPPTAVVSYSNVNGTVPGVGNFNLAEFFVNAAAKDYRLTQFSPSVDMGDPSSAGLSAIDPDGEPRVFGGRVDVGADESTGALVDLPPAAGNVGDATGLNGPFDVLTINGTAGFSGRTVDVAIGAPIHIALTGPPGVAGPFQYALCGMFGVPNASYFFPTPFGSFLFLPAPVDPSAPGFFVLASDITFAATPAIVLTAAAPISIPVTAGLPFPITVTLQAAVVAGGSGPADHRISNGVVLRVY